MLTLIFLVFFLKFARYFHKLRYLNINILIRTYDKSRCLSEFHAILANPHSSYEAKTFEMTKQPHMVA